MSGVSYTSLTFLKSFHIRLSCDKGTSTSDNVNFLLLGRLIIASNYCAPISHESSISTNESILIFAM